MLQRIDNTTSRHFSLEQISPDGMKGYLIPQGCIRKTHQIIAVTLYNDGILRIGSTQIDTKKIVPHLQSCGITATAYADGTVGVSCCMRSECATIPLYFEDEPPLWPLHLVRSRDARLPHKLKSFRRLSSGQQITTLLWPWAYPCVTV